MPGKDITWFAGKSSMIINYQGCLNGEITYNFEDSPANMFDSQRINVAS
jgi:hypothetical protein